MDRTLSRSSVQGLPVAATPKSARHPVTLGPEPTAVRSTFRSSSASTVSLLDSPCDRGNPCRRLARRRMGSRDRGWSKRPALPRSTLGLDGAWFPPHRVRRTPAPASAGPQCDGVRVAAARRDARVRGAARLAPFARVSAAFGFLWITIARDRRLDRFSHHRDASRRAGARQRARPRRPPCPAPLLKQSRHARGSDGATALDPKQPLRNWMETVS